MIDCLARTGPPAMTSAPARRRRRRPERRRLQPRHQPDRRAALQRAADPLADPPPRQRAQGRDRAPHRPLGADRLGDHARARGRRPRAQARARSAAASASRRVPFQLDPDGAFALGLKIGRRSSDMVLLDFAGAVRREVRLTHPYPTPGAVLAFVRDEPAAADRRPARRAAGADRRPRHRDAVRAVELGAGGRRAAGGDGRSGATSIPAPAIAALGPWPVTLCNDATAACAAELTLGQGARYGDFLYVFIGSFIGGGVVLNGSLYPGRTGNAGAIGSMPIARAARDGGAADPAADPQRLDLGAGEAAAGRGPRRLAAVALAARVGGFRPGARGLDRGGRGQPRARDRRGDRGARLRGGDRRWRLPGGDRRAAGRAHRASTSRRSTARACRR